MRQSSVTSNTLWASVNFFGQITVQRYVFCVHSGAPDLIYPGTSLYEHILWMHLEKNRTYACTFPVQRKEIFTMRYSSRKLSNDKVITTACNFWRQIACSFQIMSGNILFLGNKIFEIPPFFQTPPGDLGKKVHARSLRFSALNRWIDLFLHSPEFNLYATAINSQLVCLRPVVILIIFLFKLLVFEPYCKLLGYQQTCNPTWAWHKQLHIISVIIKMVDSQQNSSLHSTK